MKMNKTINMLMIMIIMMIIEGIASESLGVTKQVRWVRKGEEITKMAIFKPIDYEDLFTLSPHSLHPFIEVFLPPHPLNINNEEEENIENNIENIKNIFPSSFTSLYKFHSITKGKPFRELFSNIPQGYHDPSQLKESFLEIEINYPSIAKLIDLTSLFSLPPTVDGNSILSLKLSDNVEEDEDEENVLIVSNHHARELITPEIALSSAQLLSSSYGNNETITNLINEKQIYIIYTLNPDGLNYVWNFDNMWRKNRRNNGDGSFGVDLNRNYDFGWSFSCGGSEIKYSETYRGPFASSEIEVQTMISFQIDRSFSKVLDYHSYAMDVRPNYAECAYLPSSIDETFKEYASHLAQSTERYSLGQSCCTGGNIGNAYYYFGSLSNLIESGSSFQPPSEVMKEEVEGVWPMTFSFLTLPTPLYGHVFDANNKPLPSAFFSIPQITWEYGEVWSTSKKGRYALWLPVGEWNIEVYKTGYQNQTLSVSISSLYSV